MFQVRKVAFDMYLVRIERGRLHFLEGKFGLGTVLVRNVESPYSLLM